MNKIRFAMKLAFAASVFTAVYRIVRGSLYILEASGVILIGILSLGVIEVSSKEKHGKEVGL